MKRREFIKIGSTGLAAVALGQVGLPGVFREAQAHISSVGAVANLTMEEVMFEMADGIQVYHWAYKQAELGLRIPGPILFALEGQSIRINVTNGFPQGHGGKHAFSIPGVVDIGEIPVGQTAELAFTAPAAGTYMYLDPLNAPVNRAMGLHGALIVMPRAGNTPYSSPTPAIQNLFDDFGSPEWAPGKGSNHFPGHPWDPDRTWLWIFGSADPALHAAIRANPNLSASTFINDYVPDYYTVNGRGGFFASHGHDIGPSGNVGQPALIRCMNAGMAAHSPHIHGNHVYLLSETNIAGAAGTAIPKYTGADNLPRLGGLHGNISWVDTWSMYPGDRKDLVLPFIAPPDIPRDPQKHIVSSALSTAQRIARGGNATPWPPVEEPFPLVYPMHCHNELSQTLVGGNYPQGLVVHWQINGDIDMRVEDVFGTGRRQTMSVIPGIDGVISVDRADLRLKLGRFTLAGSYSGSPGTTIGIHAGLDASGSAKLGEVTVAGNGSWKFEGRALKLLSSRTVSLTVDPDGGSRRVGVPLRLI